MNIRELSVGSFVRVNLGRYGFLTGMVGEIGRRQMGVFIIEKTLVPASLRRFTIGKLLYRHNKAQNRASFRFMSDFTKTYTRISCYCVHELQTIMRFLTGGELEFEYKTTLYE